MHPGPARGEQATMTVTVTDEMSARFDDEDVHPVYGTVALVRHMEQLSRRLLEPHLESGEEGVGVRMELQHRAPVPVGAQVELQATVADVNPRRLVTDVLVRSGGRIVAHGVFEQAVVDLEAWRSTLGFVD